MVFHHRLSLSLWHTRARHTRARPHTHTHTHTRARALTQVFSPDFLTLFEATAYLLDDDPTIWCVSSWNDNGFAPIAKDNTRLFRTNYFPGLGWMLKRELFLSLEATWPNENWCANVVCVGARDGRRRASAAHDCRDHWMRVSSQHQGRDCVVPEVSRNHNIGERGANVNPRDFKKFLANVRFNEERNVQFGNLDYLLGENYEQIMQRCAVLRLPFFTISFCVAERVSVASECGERAARLRVASNCGGSQVRVIGDAVAFAG